MPETILNGGGDALHAEALQQTTEERRDRDRDSKNRVNEEIQSHQLQQEVIEEEERDWD